MDNTLEWQDEVDGLISRLGDLEGPLLPLLHAIQDSLGHVPPQAIPVLAKALNLSTAEVHGAMSFYPDFHSQPQGRVRVQVCCAEACQARGSRDLESLAPQRLGIDYGDTSADGEVTLERVYCLGNCACGPSLRLGDDVYGRVDAARFEQLLDTALPVPPP